MMGDLQVHLPTAHWLFGSFWPKTAWPPCPTLPIHLISIRTTLSFVCFPGWKKVLKEKHFANVEEMWQKTAEALNGIKINHFKNCFEHWKNTSWWVYCIKWRVLWRWLEFKYVRINTQLFINTFWVFVSPLMYNVYLGEIGARYCGYSAESYIVLSLRKAKSSGACQIKQQIWI